MRFGFMNLILLYSYNRYVSDHLCDHLQGGKYKNTNIVYRDHSTAIITYLEIQIVYCVTTPSLTNLNHKSHIHLILSTSVHTTTLQIAVFNF
jgi:hypothetical protein